MHVVSERFQQRGQVLGKILIELDSHPTEGTAATICSIPSPSARLASTVRRVTRVPRNTGSPPQICGFRITLPSRKPRPPFVSVMAGTSSSASCYHFTQCQLSDYRSAMVEG